MTTKTKAYQDLVQTRKECLEHKNHKFLNQSHFEEYDTDHIGNYSTWAHDLNADLIIVGQDFSNEATFKRDKGKIQLREIKDPEVFKEWDTGTNYYLWKLLSSIGREIGTPDSPTHTGKVFLTNAVLDLKPGKMNASIPKKVYEYSGRKFLMPLVNIIQPKVIITLGTGASQAVLSLYQDEQSENKKFKSKPFCEIFQHGPFVVNQGNTRVIPVYHPGSLGQANRKKIESDKSKTGFELMKEDWNKIKSLL